ncbi:MAG: hypothetical protein ACYC8S_01070 [Minisyncoccota bacterium]
MQAPKLMQTLKSLTLALLLVAGVSYAASWMGPNASPPANNVDAPLNVGPASQSKLGDVTVQRTETQNGTPVITGAISAPFINGVFGTFQKVGVASSQQPRGALTLGVEGAVGATQYCDQNGDKCVAPGSMGGGGGGGGSGGLGVGQTWQVVTRTSNTQYVNDTGKPIYVSVMYGSNTGSSGLLGHFSLIVDGVRVSKSAGAAVYNGSFGGIVPPGSTYVIIGSIYSVAELR